MLSLIYTLQFTIAHANSSQFIFASECLVTHPNIVLFCSRPYCLVTVLYLTHCSKCQPKPKLCYDQQSVGQSALVSSTHLGLNTRFLSLSNSCGFDVRRLFWWRTDLLFTTAADPHQHSHSRDQVPLGLMAILYCIRFESPETWKARFPYLYPPKNRVAQLYLRHCVPFLSPPTTHRAMVDACEPAFKWGANVNKVKVKVTLWLTVSQSVSLGVKPHLGLMTRYLLLFDSCSLVFVGLPL
jgi:hypothetical protein